MTTVTTQECLVPASTRRAHDDNTYTLASHSKIFSSFIRPEGRLLRPPLQTLNRTRAH